MGCRTKHYLNRLTSSRHNHVHLDTAKVALVGWSVTNELSFQKVPSPVDSRLLAAWHWKAIHSKFSAFILHLEDST